MSAPGLGAVLSRGKVRLSIIPPLIIQPLVENSIVHGLEPLEEGGTVHIVLELIKKRLFITIRDTGVGITDSDKVQVLEATTKVDNSHIGMTNVLERIKLYYGKTAKMEIEQAQPKGTVIRLTLPIRRQDRLGG